MFVGSQTRLIGLQFCWNVGKAYMSYGDENEARGSKVEYNTNTYDVYMVRCSRRLFIVEKGTPDPIFLNYFTNF